MGAPSMSTWTQSNLVTSDPVGNPDPAEPVRPDPVAIWKSLCRAAEEVARREPLLAGYVESLLLCQGGLAGALGALLAEKLTTAAVLPTALAGLIRSMIDHDPAILGAAVADLQACADRDPAAGGLITPFLWFKGYQGLQGYRVAHRLWHEGRTETARFLQSRISEVFGMDIHPAARIGRRVFIDHATGVVIGETAVVEDDVSILQGVTLGGTGKERGDRHPKIRRGVLIGAGAKILGNIEIGPCSKVGAGSVVLHAVPPRVTVAGVPARIVGHHGIELPARAMDQSLTCTDC